MAHSRSAWKLLAALAVALMLGALALWRQLDASMEQRSQAPDGTRIQVYAGASLRVVLANWRACMRCATRGWSSGICACMRSRCGHKRASMSWRTVPVRGRYSRNCARGGWCYRR